MQAPLEEHIESETQEIVQKVQKQQANQIDGKRWIQNKTIAIMVDWTSKVWIDSGLCAIWRNIKGRENDAHNTKNVHSERGREV